MSHSSHTIVDISDVSYLHDITCKTCGMFDEQLDEACRNPLNDFMICEFLRVSGDPIQKAAARRLEFMTSGIETIVEAGDRNTMVVEPMARETLVLFHRVIGELLGIVDEVIPMVDPGPDGQAREALYDRRDNALGCQEPAWRHIQRIEAIGKAARERCISRAMLKPPAPIVIDAKDCSCHG